MDRSSLAAVEGSRRVAGNDGRTDRIRGLREGPAQGVEAAGRPTGLNLARRNRLERA